MRFEQILQTSILSQLTMIGCNHSHITIWLILKVNKKVLEILDDNDATMKFLEIINKKTAVTIMKKHLKQN